MRGEDHRIDVAAQCPTHQRERTQDIDTLLLRRTRRNLDAGRRVANRTAARVTLIAVLQRPEGHGYPLVTLPLRLLGLVPSVCLRLVVWARLPTEHVHVAENGPLVTFALAAVPYLKQLVREMERVDQRIVLRSVTRRVELPVPSEVHVLVVDDDCCPEIGHGHSTRTKEKAPPVPEDGGELGLNHDTPTAWRQLLTA